MPWTKFPQIENAIAQGLDLAWRQVRVEPNDFLVELRVDYGLDLAGYGDLRENPVEALDAIADEIIQHGVKLATTSGAGLGLGGVLTILPDMAVLGIVTMRTMQKLSLLYGFDYNDPGEMREFWTAFGTAVGVQVVRERVERAVVRRFAAEMSASVLRRGMGRLVPVLSSIVGGALNYYFVSLWGHRAKGYFHEKHEYRRMQAAAPPPPQAAGGLPSPS